METSRPAHILADVIKESGPENERYFLVTLRTDTGDVSVWIPSQYVLVGDVLEDLYPDLEETDE